MYTTKQWFSMGDYAEIDGHHIFYICNNNIGKPVILLIHGFPTSSWDWHEIWDDLSADYHLIAMDMLGFGYSAKPNPHQYSIHEQADMIEQLVAKLQLTQFHVLAHDYGDTVAQELLARQNAGKGDEEDKREQKWQSVCFLNGGLFPETHQALFIQKLLLSPIGFLVNKFSTKSSFDASFSRVFGEETKPTPEELAYFWALINYNDGKHLFHNGITYMRDRKQHRTRWVEALQKAIVPIGLINGSVDPVSGAHMVTHYKNIVGQPDFLCALPKIGHYPQVEAPSEVATNYMTFLQEVGS